MIFTTRGRDEVLKALGYNGHPEDVVEGNFGDEIWLSIDMPVDKQDQRFREYMKERGFDPLELIPDKMSENPKSLTKEEQWKLVTVTESRESIRMIMLRGLSSIIMEKAGRCTAAL